jgi:DNA-directed RNA polymerase subunit K/omega
MIQRPTDIGRFEFVILSALRTAQLLRGCPPRIDVDVEHKATTTAQLEVSIGKITRIEAVPDRVVE